jgi:hypothetical protein
MVARNGLPALNAVDEPMAQAQPSPPNAHRWLLWTAGTVVAAVCIAVFLLWGIYGPSFIFDLIAAYCIG